MIEAARARNVTRPKGWGIPQAINKRSEKRLAARKARARLALSVGFPVELLLI